MISNFVAGDTIEFEQFYSEYTSDTYTATLYFNGPSNLSVVGTPNADNGFTFTITAAQTTYLKSGLYAYAVRVALGVNAYTVETGNITVQPNLAVQTSKEAICNRMIELIEKALLNQLSSGEAAESISIAGRSISMMNRKDLLTERSFWDRERKALLNARLGRSGIRQISIIV